jgi:Dehydrogenases (flavoproteins)
MQFIEVPAQQVPVRLEADVVVCGGGPAGIGAALAAARTGAKTVLIERYGFLGGMGTAAAVCTFAYGYHDKRRFIIGGVFQEIRTKLHQRGALIMTERKGWEPFNPEHYKMLAFDLLQEAGVHILCHTYVSDVLVDNGRIKAVLIESKAGRQAVVADLYIDATGDGDVAARAGVPFEIGRESDQATQPHTLMYFLGNVDVHKTGEMLAQTGRRGYWRTPEGKPYLNATGFVDEIKAAKAAGYLPTIMRDHVASIFTIPWLDNVVGVNFGRITGRLALDPKALTEAEIIGREQIREGLEFLRRYVPGFERAEVIATGPQVGVRETRRIMGEYVINKDDIIEQRQFDDVIAQSCYMIDIHSPDSDTTTIVKLPPGTHYDIPYRSLVPKQIDNLLLAGRCISATHEALGSFRVQAICLALGQAAGTAAALCAQKRTTPRELNVADLQKRLEVDGAILS